MLDNSQICPIRSAYGPAKTYSANRR